MRRTIQILSAAALAVAVTTPSMAAECVKPGPSPVMPQGATATKEEMLAGKGDLQKYINALQGYQDCLELQIKGAPKETKSNVLQRWRDEGNAAIDEATAQAAIYSSQVKAFNARPH